MLRDPISEGGVISYWRQPGEISIFYSGDSTQRCHFFFASSDFDL